MTVSASVITMFYLPIEFEGYRVDLRMIPLIFLAYFGNWRLTLPILLIVCVWRVLIGGGYYTGYLIWYDWSYLINISCL